MSDTDETDPRASLRTLSNAIDKNEQLKACIVKLEASIAVLKAANESQSREWLEATQEVERLKAEIEQRKSWRLEDSPEFAVFMERLANAERVSATLEEDARSLRSTIEPLQAESTLRQECVRALTAELAVERELRMELERKLAVDREVIVQRAKAEVVSSITAFRELLTEGALTQAPERVSPESTDDSTQKLRLIFEQYQAVLSDLEWKISEVQGEKRVLMDAQAKARLESKPQNDETLKRQQALDRWLQIATTSRETLAGESAILKEYLQACEIARGPAPTIREDIAEIEALLDETFAQVDAGSVSTGGTKPVLEVASMTYPQRVDEIAQQCDLSSILVLLIALLKAMPPKVYFSAPQNLLERARSAGLITLPPGNPSFVAQAVSEGVAKGYIETLTVGSKRTGYCIMLRKSHRSASQPFDHRSIFSSEDIQRFEKVHYQTR